MSFVNRSFLALCLTAPLWATPSIADDPARPEDTASDPALELVMVERAGCAWCARWNEEIAPIWPKSQEGAQAPLRRIDLHKIPDDLTLEREVIFTPTFILVDDDRELSRLEGYPGADFFWPIVSGMIAQATAATASDGGATPVEN